MPSQRNSNSQSQKSNPGPGVYYRRGSLGEDTRIRWVDECDLDIGQERVSISSEDGDEHATTRRQRETRPHRTAERHELYNAAEVANKLRALPGGDELVALITVDDVDGVVRHHNARDTGALMAAWYGKNVLLKTLLDKTADSAKVTDSEGRTPLHLACYVGATDCCQLLVQHGANISAWDKNRRATPLHCAASSGSLQCLKQLILAGSDVNVGIAVSSPLHCAVQSDAVECVRELLENGACPNTPQVFTETPLHVAAALGSVECLRLLLAHGADVRVQFGLGKVTPLHLASEDGNAEGARLLLDASAQVGALNGRKQTPLHLAALSQSAETVELLLQRGASVNAEDCDGRTPLHCAIVKVSRSCDCVRLLLDAGANVNKADAFGYTPLHIAALDEFPAVVCILLSHGGDATARTLGGVTALSFIVRRTPDVLPRFLAALDSSVELHDHDIGDVDCELKLDFRILVPNVDRGETELLLAFVEVGQRQILKHPLCETFLFLKWRRIRKFFIFSLSFHATFVLLFSAYIIVIFHKHCPKPNVTEQNNTSTHNDDEHSNCIVPQIMTYQAYFLLIMNIILLAKEIFQLCHGWLAYVGYWENWLQCAIIASTFMCVVHFHSITDIANDVQTWHHHIAAIGIFLTWLELMMIVGRFPMFGLYVQMFTTVAWNFAKFLLAYSCMLIAFGLSFGVLFPNYKAFEHVMWGIMKTVVMMSGELEFESIFYGDDNENEILYPVTSHLIFLAFVVLITVILTNLMVGLAVSDIQGLQKSAGLDRLVRQAQLVARLESMLFSRLLLCLPKKLLAVWQRSALLLTSSYHWTLYLRPNDPREARVPRDLVNEAFRLVAERKEKPKRHGKFVQKSPRTGNQHVRLGNLWGSMRDYNQYLKADEDEKRAGDAIKDISALLTELQDCATSTQEKISDLTMQISALRDEIKQQQEKNK